MNNKKILFTLTLLLSQLAAFAQQGPEMAFDMRDSGKIYVVVAVMALIFLGTVVFLVSIERRLNRLEKQRQQEKKQVQ